MTEVMDKSNQQKKTYWKSDKKIYENNEQTQITRKLAF